MIKEKIVSIGIILMAILGLISLVTPLPIAWIIIKGMIFLGILSLIIIAIIIIKR